METLAREKWIADILTVALFVFLLFIMILGATH